jgi:integrase
LSKEELNRLLGMLQDWPNERASLIVKFALFSNRRRGEILDPLWDEADLGQGFIRIKTKNKKVQAFPIIKICNKILQRASSLKISNYVFPSNTGGHYSNTFKGTWRAIGDKAILKNFRFHDLRHTYANYLTSSVIIDIYTLQKLLGHQTIAVKQRYAHLIDSALKREASVAEEAIK